MSLASVCRSLQPVQVITFVVLLRTSGMPGGAGQTGSGDDGCRCPSGPAVYGFVIPAVILYSS